MPAVSYAAGWKYKKEGISLREYNDKKNWHSPERGRTVKIGHSKEKKSREETGREKTSREEIGGTTRTGWKTAGRKRLDRKPTKGRRRA